VTRNLEAVDKWFMCVSFSWIEFKKRDQLENIDSLLDNLEPYFANLTACLRELWDVLFTAEQMAKGKVWRDLHDCVGTHDGMLRVLEANFAWLPDIDPPVDPVAAPPLLTKKSSTKSLRPTLTSQKQSSYFKQSCKQSLSKQLSSSSRQTLLALEPSSSQQPPPSQHSMSMCKHWAHDDPPHEDSDPDFQLVDRRKERVKCSCSNPKGG
jgi:hypothetical protein